MAIRKYAGDKITGLSSDTKPSNVSDGATFYETDTRKNYLLVSGSWVEILASVSSLSEASTATPTPIGSSFHNAYFLTALATNATLAAPSGTPTNGNRLIVRIKDNGTSRTLAYNAIYRAIGLTLPTATTISKTIYLGCVYNSADSVWDVIAYQLEA